MYWLVCRQYMDNASVPLAAGMRCSKRQVCPVQEVVQVSVDAGVPSCQDVVRPSVPSE